MPRSFLRAGVAHDEVTAGAQRLKDLAQHLRLQFARKIMQHIIQQHTVARRTARFGQQVAELQAQLRIVAGRCLQADRRKPAAVHFMNCFSLVFKLQHPNAVN